MGRPFPHGAGGSPSPLRNRQSERSAPLLNAHREQSDCIPGAQIGTMTSRQKRPGRTAISLLMVPVIATMLAACGGPPKPTAVPDGRSLVVSFGGVSLNVPRGWSVLDRQVPICGATPEDDAVYAWKEHPGPSPSCSGRLTSAPYIALACPLSNGETVSSTSTTVVGGLKVILEDEGGGIISVWPPPGHPFIYIHTPLDPQIARRISLSVRSAPGGC